VFADLFGGGHPVAQRYLGLYFPKLALGISQGIYPFSYKGV
jgi:hypothetical protein